MRDEFGDDLRDGRADRDGAFDGDMLGVFSGAIGRADSGVRLDTFQSDRQRAELSVGERDDFLAGRDTCADARTFAAEDPSPFPPARQEALRRTGPPSVLNRPR